MGGGQAGDVEESVCEHMGGVCVCVCAFWITQVLYVCLFFREENMWPPISKRRQKLTLMSKPGCTPGLSPEGHIVDINPIFFSQGPLIARHSVGLAKLLFKDFIPHNHLHPAPFKHPPIRLLYHSLLISLCLTSTESVNCAFSSECQSTTATSRRINLKSANYCRRQQVGLFM